VVDAYFRGYEEAIELGCEWILEMDGGFSHRPEEIPRFVEAMERGFDFAAGSRFIKGGSHHGSLRRYLVSRGGSLLTNCLLGTRMRDMTSGFECFTRAALRFVVDRGVRSRAHFFQTEIRAMLASWNWVEIPITYTNPSNSVGKAQIADAMRCLWALSREPRPAKPNPVHSESACPS
jgi:dolichol-phosphate mannosyltransferase